MTLVRKPTARTQILHPNFYFFSIKFVDGGEAHLFLTPMEALLTKWAKGMSEGERPSQRTSQNSLVKLFHVVDASDGIYYMHFCRYNTSIADSDIVNTEIGDVDKITKLARLADKHAGFDHCICAYDLKTGLFAWQKNDKVSISAITTLLSLQLGPEIELVPVAYADTLEELPRINPEKVSFYVDFRDPEKLAQILADENNLPNGAAVKILKKLQELTDELGGVEIDVVIRSLADSRDNLNERGIQVIAKAIRNLVGASDKEVGMVVEGALKSEFAKKEMNLDQMRVLDICEGLLNIRGHCEVDLDATALERFPVMEKCVYDALNLARNRIE